MRNQQKIWSDEHKTAIALPTEMVADEGMKPSSFVVLFNDLLRDKRIFSGKAIDIGAGKGRNAFYMASQGFELFAIDYIPEAIDFIRKVAKLRGLDDRIHTCCQAIDEKWPFEDNFFDIAIDCFASIDVETSVGRVTYRNELYRTLCRGGYAMVSVVSSDDEIEGEMIRAFPGHEKNSTIWPQNGKYQKNYDEQELRDFYKDFQIIELRKVSKNAYKLGRHFTATNFWLVLQKT